MLSCRQHAQLPGGTAFDRLTANSLKTLWMCWMLQRSISVHLLYQVDVNNEPLQQQLESCTTVRDQIAKPTVFFFIHQQCINTKTDSLASGWNWFIALLHRQLILHYISGAASDHSNTEKWVSFLPPTTVVGALPWVASFLLTGHVLAHAPHLVWLSLDCFKLFNIFSSKQKVTNMSDSEIRAIHGSHQRILMSG